MKRTLLILICLGFLIGMMPISSPAFETVRYDNGMELTVWGFLRNNTAMFTQNPNPWGQTEGQSGNQLAIERTVLRTYMDWKMSEQFRFWLVGQFAYEPWYPVEQGADVKKNGNEYSEFKNVNDILREVYIEWKPNKKTSIKVGRMNVIWGETITGRIGDVVNPGDIRWALPIAAEAPDDQRIPQYMIRGIHDIDSLNSSFEWIVSPILTSPEYAVSRSGATGNLFTATAGSRFGMAPEMRVDFNRSFSNPALARVDAALANYGPPNYAVDTNPMATTWNYNPMFNPGNGWSPSVYSFGPGGLTITNEIPDVRVKLPDGIDNIRGGFRTATTVSGYTFGAIYYHRQNFEPIMRKEGIVRSVSESAGPGVTVVNNFRRYSLEYPDVDNIGFYMNKQLPWPGVIRAEVMYTPNSPYNYFLPLRVVDPLGSEESGFVKRDNIKYLFAYDLNGFIYPDWHKTAPIDITFEHTGEWIPNARDLQYAAPYTIGQNYNTKLPTWQGNFNFKFSTNWFYNILATELIAGYGTFGNSILLVPSVKWMPGWMNKKFSAELKYVWCTADSRYEGLGVWKDKNYLQLLTQFNF